MTALHDLTANEIVTQIAARELSPVELVEALLRRSEALDPDLRIWASLDAESARATAREQEAAVMTGAPPRLFGLPVGIKDIFYTAGLRTSANSPLLADFVPGEDAGAVARLRQDGAIVLGKTVTTQFADGDPAETRNPWNRQRTPGGSSSGSAAGVAARLFPAALGTQTAGSVVRPAGFCGVVGLKPTFGRISRRNVIPFAWSLDTIGIISRDVRDAALLLRALAAHDPLDDGSVEQEIEHFRAAANEPRAPRLGLLREFADLSESDVGAQLQTTARKLEAAGATIVDLRLPADLDLALASHLAIQIVEASDLHAARHASQPDAYGPRLRGAIESGRLIPGAAYVRAQRLRSILRAAVERQLEDLDAYLLPTASHLPPTPETTGDTRFQAVWTMLGLPAISLPSGLSADGLPFATQLVSRAWNETGLLSAASWCEQAFGPMPAPPV